MSISLYTAFTIQNPDNDIRCESYDQCEATGKCAGAINLYHNDHFHTTLLSSQQIHDSEKMAIIAMKNVVKQIREANLL